MIDLGCYQYTHFLVKQLYAFAINVILRCLRLYGSKKLVKYRVVLRKMLSCTCQHKVVLPAVVLHWIYIVILHKSRGAMYTAAMYMRTAARQHTYNRVIAYLSTKNLNYTYPPIKKI
jgi:hypothetical protein